MTTLTIPAFDADSPDADILEAFEKVRAHRVHVYSFDGLHDSDPEEWNRVNERLEVLDVDAQAQEGLVFNNWATTPTGVAAQLAISVTGQCERWVDRGLCEQGLLALYNRRSELDGRDQATVIAAYELLHIEWEHALANYERSAAAFDLILSIKTEVDKIRMATPIGDAAGRDLFPEMVNLVDQAEDHFSNLDDVRRLFRTLAPDWTSYRRKAEICLAEGLAGEAAPWMIRDVNFLTGVILDDDAQAEAAE